MRNMARCVFESENGSGRNNSLAHLNHDVRKCASFGSSVWRYVFKGILRRGRTCKVCYALTRKSSIEIE